MTNASIPALIQKISMNVLRLAQVRAELFSVELAQEIIRTKRLILIAASAAVSLTLALALGSAFLIIFFWDHARVLVSGVLTLIALITGLTALLLYRWSAMHSKGAFSDTWRSVKLDFDTIQTPHE